MTEIHSDYIRELLNNGVIAFVPSGNSMWPTLKNRKQSVIVKKKTDKLRPMDVALYCRENGSNVLHRVIKATDFGYIMCGDSQFTPEKVIEDNVYGVMTGFYRGKKYIDVNDAGYIGRVKKLYKSEKRRKFYVKMFFLSEWIKSLPKRAWHKLFGKKRKAQGDGND